MTTKRDILLQALHIALESIGAGWLEPDRVTGLGTVLGLQTEETVELIEKLRAAGLIEIAWGGKVALTEKGRDHASGQVGHAGTYLGPGATYVGSGAYVSNAAVGAGAIAGAVGEGAMAQGATRIDLHPGELVLALSELHRVQLLPGSEEQVTVQQLEGEVQGILEEAQKQNPDGATLEKHLERTRGLLEKVAGISEAVGKLGPALKLIAKGVGLTGISYLL